MTKQSSSINETNKSATWVNVMNTSGADKRKEKRSQRRSRKRELNNTYIAPTNAKKVLELDSYNKTIKSISNHGLNLIEFSSDEWQSLVEKSKDISQYIKCPENTELWMLDDTAEVPTLINKENGELIQFKEGIGYKAGKGVAQKLKGNSVSPRTNFRNNEDVEKIIADLLNIAKQDESMSAIESSQASKVASFDRPRLGDWVENITSWYDPVNDNIDHLTMALACETFISRMREVMKNAYALYDSVDDETNPVIKIGDNYHIRPMPIDQAYEQTTKGRHYGYPFFNSQWSGDDSYGPRGKLMANELKYEAQQCLDNETYFDTLEPITVLFCRTGRNKIRMVLAPPKANAVLGRAMAGNAIPIFQESEQFCGFLGGENVGNVIYNLMSTHKWASEADMATYDMLVKAVLPYAIATTSRLCHPKFKEAFISWVRYSCRTGILIGYGVVSPKSADQLMGVISGDTFTSLLGGIGSALAFEYAKLRRLSEKNDWWFKPSRVNKIPDQYYSVNLFTGDEVSLKSNAFDVMADVVDVITRMATINDYDPLDFNVKDNSLVDETIELVNNLPPEENIRILNFGDDAAIFSNFNPEELFQYVEETGLKISKEKSNTHYNGYFTCNDLEHLMQQSNDPSQRVSFLGWHYFQYDAALYKLGGTPKGGRVSIMRSIASKLIWQERDAFLTRASEFAKLKQDMLDNANVELTEYDLEAALGTVMKLNLAQNNDCFSQLTKYTRDGSLLKLHSSMIVSLESAEVRNVVRDKMRISFKSLDKGLSQLPIMREIYRQEEQEGIISIDPLINGVTKALDDDLPNALGLTRPKFEVISKDEARVQSSFKSQSANNKANKQKVKHISIETSRAQNSIDKQLSAIEDLINELKSISGLAKDASKSRIERIPLISQVSAGKRQLLGAKGKHGKLSELSKLIERRIAEGVIDAAYAAIIDEISNEVSNL